jgi:DNA-binding LacI/PurR family transcriptional regulator
MAPVVEPGCIAELVEFSIFSVEGGHAAAMRLLDRGCTAIVCGSDLMALGAIRAARTRGLDVPGEVSVVGYDDSP